MTDSTTPPVNSKGRVLFSSLIGTTPEPPPVRPDEPEPADCCGEGCARCVFDVYDEAIERYEAELASWRARANPPKTMLAEANQASSNKSDCARTSFSSTNPDRPTPTNR